MRRHSWSARTVILLAVIAVAAVSAAQEVIKPPNRRIIGGEKTDIKEHPWQVALQFRGSFYCGGSIIGQKWILTAAHCFAESADGGDWRAKAGVTNPLTSGVWADIERVVVHERYVGPYEGSDIALIKLKGPANGKIIPLVPATTVVPVGQPLEVSGWGKTETASTSADLLKATVPYVDTSTCNEKEAYDGRIKPGMLCAGRREGGADSCNGDSGGPLVWRQPDGPVLVGVVSWGDGCALQLKYGVYTSVAIYRDWIQRAVATFGN